MRKILQTDRLILREFEISDAEKIWELNSDPEVIQYTGDAPFDSEDQAREFLVEYNDYQENGYGRWAVIEKKTHEFIGWCGLKLNEDGVVDIGFRFFKKVWSLGYATESAQACLDYGFNTLMLDEIIGRAARENTASIRVLEKLKMTFWKEGASHGMGNTVYYRITRRCHNQE
jgi:ribosomal-protein-alanine N-acetyltransferase